MIRKLLEADERTLRRWMLKRDPTFALHAQLRDYFLTRSTDFGATGNFDSDTLTAVTFWSKVAAKTYVHAAYGDKDGIRNMLAEFGPPCQIFLRAEQLTWGIKPEAWTWEKTLDVTPGYIVDHDAYSGVFARVVPRFAGAVFEWLS